MADALDLGAQSSEAAPLRVDLMRERVEVKRALAPSRRKLVGDRERAWGDVAREVGSVDVAHEDGQDDLGVGLVPLVPLMVKTG